MVETRSAAGPFDGRVVAAHTLHGDASSRRYRRLVDAQGRTAIEAQYPVCPDQSVRRDVDVLRWLAARGLRVPALLDVDLEAGRLLLEDLGDDDAAAVLEATSADQREHLALRLVEPLTLLARIAPHELPAWSRPLDEQRLRWELAGFELWFLRHLCGRSPGGTWGAWLDRLAAQVARHPIRVCHRDYHLNNLYLLTDSRQAEVLDVGVIDVQDVLVGPDTYDAVSLVFERAFPDLLEADARQRWLQAWASMTDARPGWELRCRQTRLQRALKVLGTFARLVLCGRTAYAAWISEAAKAAAGEAAMLDAPCDLAKLLGDTGETPFC